MVPAHRVPPLKHVASSRTPDTVPLVTVVDFSGNSLSIPHQVLVVGVSQIHDPVLPQEISVPGLPGPSPHPCSQDPVPTLVMALGKSRPKKLHSD